MRIDTSLGTTLDTRGAARLAEESSIDGAWTGEVTHDPLLALTLAATTTEKIDLGTSITLAFARNPMSLAVQANDVHALSGGRVILGLGSQVKAHITRRFSMPWSRPAARMREYVLALRSIWTSFNTGADLSFEGEFYTHTLLTPFFRPEPNPFGAPRVFLAAVGEAMTTVAGEVADGILLHGFTTEAYLREVTTTALTKGRAAASGGDTDFEVAGMPFVATGATEQDLERAKDAVRGQIAFYASTPAYRPVLSLHGWDDLGEKLHTMTRSGDWSAMARAIDDEVLDAFAVVGPPSGVAEELTRRFGDVMTRIRLYTPYPLDPDIATQIHADLRATR